MKKPLLGFLVFFGLVGAIIVAATLQGEKEPETLLGDSATFKVFRLATTTTDGGYLSVNYRSDDREQRYLSIVADTNNNGTFQMPEEWVVRNMPPRIRADYQNSYPVTFPEGISFSEQDSLNIRIALTDEPLDELWSGQAVAVGEFKELQAGVVVEDLTQRLGINVPGASVELKRGNPGAYDFSLTKRAFAHGGEEHAAQEEDFSVMRRAPVPDTTQGDMECSPTSVSNSLISLAGEHSALDMLPETDREIIAELRQDMNWADGVTNENFLAGKAAFVERYNLPVKTEHIFTPTFEDIVNALRNGAAIELSMRMINSESGKANTGHAVTVVGASRVDGHEYIHYHDPGTDGGGMETMEFDEIVRDAGDREFMGVEYSPWDGLAFVDEIFVQTWTEAEQATEGGETEEGEQTSRVEMLVIGESYYPKVQFTAADPDECGAPHWHAQGTVYGLETKTSTGIVNATDPAPNMCGFGKLSEVPVEFVDITFEQSTELIKHLPGLEN